MEMWNSDPGPCPVCGVAHCACGGPATECVILPARDAMAAGPPAPVVEMAPVVVPPDTPFTTATYRGRTPDGRIKVSRR